MPTIHDPGFINSTMTPLAGGGVFTGGMEKVDQVSSITIFVFADVSSATNGFSLEFSVDGIYWDRKKTVTVAAGVSSVHTLTSITEFFRVVYINGAAAQGAFRLYTRYHIHPAQHLTSTMVQTVTNEVDVKLQRSVIMGATEGSKYSNVGITQGLNAGLKIAVVEPLTASGDLRTSELSLIFGGTFEYTVDNAELSTNVNTNGGGVTQSTAMAVVSTSTTTDSTACLQSHPHARYHAGLGAMCRFTALFATPVAATEQLVGLADETGSSVAFKNGYMVGYVGTTFGFHRFSNDTITTTALADWDDPLDGTGPSGITIDPQMLNEFFISFHIAAGAIYLNYERSDTGQDIRVLTVPYAGLFTVPQVYNPNFHFMIWANNKDTTSNIIVKSGSYAYFVEGKTQHIEQHVPTESSGEKEKTTVTTEVAILTVRSRASYASKTNFISSVLLSFYCSIEASSANNLGKCRLVKGATLGGSPSYSNINTNNSVMEIDTAGTTVTGGIELSSAPLAGKNDSAVLDVRGWQILLQPGETLTIAGSSANSATIKGGVVWQELF